MRLSDDFKNLSSGLLQRLMSDADEELSGQARDELHRRGEINDLSDWEEEDRIGDEDDEWSFDFSDPSGALSFSAIVTSSSKSRAMNALRQEISRQQERTLSICVTPIDPKVAKLEFRVKASDLVKNSTARLNSQG